ncbi:MAG: hypothetical protein ABIH38_05030 [Patescibacteria group bacterium]
MKRFIGIMMVLFMFFLGGCAAAVKSEKPVESTESIVAAPIPITGEYTVEESIVRGKFEIIQVKGEMVTIKIPMPDPAAVKLDDIVIFVSVAWTDGQSWKIVSSDDYSRFVSLLEIADDGAREIRLQIPNKGNGWFWLRIWGRNKTDQSWLWIKKEDPYIRLDTGGNPGYEVIVNNCTGESKPVPKEYNNRQ